MRHPAVFHDRILRRGAALLDEYLPRSTAAIRQQRPCFVLDPFAGTGKVHELMRLCKLPVETFGVELMPKWAAMHKRTLRGDATDLVFASRQFHGVFTSPCYGNRMADHHDATDPCSCRKSIVDGSPFVSAFADRECPKCEGSGLSPRRSYRHDYGPDFWGDAPWQLNAGAMQWGPEYRDLHRAAWREAYRVLKKNGIAIVNVKDHVRDKKRVRVSAWHLSTLKAVGFETVRSVPIPLRGNGFGQNREARVPNEILHVVVKP